MKKLALLGVVVIFCGCKELKGNLSVGVPFTLVNEKKEVVPVPAGSYQGELGFDEKKRKIQFKIKNVNGKDQKVAIVVPFDVEMPGENGTLLLSPDQTGQPFSITGTVQSSTHDSPPYEGFERCTYYTTRRQCRTIVEEGGRRGGRRWREECRDVQVSRGGTQQVRWHMSDYSKNAQVSFYQQGREIARYRGYFNNSDKVYEYVGRCY